MRLTELDPHWVTCLGFPEGVHLGVRFNMPTDQSRRMAVFFDVPINGVDPIDMDKFREAQQDCDHPRFEQWMNETHVGINLWHRTGETFENLTLTPSIDGSEWGGWHGHITNGAIT